MKAVAYDRSSDSFILREAPDPKPKRSELLIEVKAFSLNHGEIKIFSKMGMGSVPGWDAAGTVVQSVPGGPEVGSSIVSFSWGGAWAERRAVNVKEVAIIPEGVEIGEASTLPVAACTALRALKMCGDIKDKRILITGASGGVGRFAVQLAHLMGAYVIAMVGSPERGAGLKELGADEIDTTLSEVHEKVFGVVDTVAGELFGPALGKLERRGKYILVGNAAGLPMLRLDFRIRPFQLGKNLAPDLEYLLHLMAEKKLQPQIGWRGDWSRINEAAIALLDRKVLGKAVLDIGGSDARS